jgi:hypothetical protein
MNLDRVWVRFYFKLTSGVTTIQKFARFQSGASGGLYLRQGDAIFAFAWDHEYTGAGASIGLTEAQVIDGNWHSIEFEYWRNGDPSGWPSAAFWFDGMPTSMPDGARAGGGEPTNQSYWSGGRLYAGARSYSGQLQFIEMLATLNTGNTTSGQVNIDRLAISSLGRIGP